MLNLVHIIPAKHERVSIVMLALTPTEQCGVDLF